MVEEDTDVDVLKEWLYKEIAEKEYYRNLLHTRVGLVKLDQEEDHRVFEPIQRHVPMRIRRAQKEAEQHKKATEMRTKKKADLTEGEKLFEDSLKEAN